MRSTPPYHSLVAARSCVHVCPQSRVDTLVRGPRASGLTPDDLFGSELGDFNPPGGEQ